MEKGYCACTGIFPREVPCGGLHIEDICADSHGGMKGLQGKWDCGGPVEINHWYHYPKADLGDPLIRHFTWVSYGTWDGDRHPQG